MSPLCTTEPVGSLNEKSLQFEVAADLNVSGAGTQKIISLGKSRGQQCSLHFENTQSNTVIKKNSLLEITGVETRYAGEGFILVPFKHKAYGTIKKPKYKYTRSAYTLSLLGSEGPYTMKCLGKKAENEFTERGRYQFPLKSPSMTIEDLSRVLSEGDILRLRR